MKAAEIPKKNIDLENLGMINQDLFYVKGELAKRYNKVLKNVFDFDCDADSFRIDKRGLSPELCKYLKEKYPERLEYGENYLNLKSANMFMVVVSPDQKNAPLIAPLTSYENELYNITNRLARHTIEDITQTEALFGQIENRISIFNSAYDLLQLRTIELGLETLNGTVGSILELRKFSDNLGKGKNALDPEYISSMQDIVKKVGDIRQRDVSEIFPIRREIHCFYVEFFKGIHCLRNFKNKEGLRTLLILHHQGSPRNIGEQILTMDLHDPSLVDVLHKYNFLEYDPKLIGRRISEIEDETLLSEGIDVVELTTFERERLVVKYSPKLPKSFRELKEIAGIIENSKADLDELLEDRDYEIKLKLSESSDEDEIVDHMLAELDPTDISRLYNSNRKKMLVEFPNLPLNRQRYIAHTIINKSQEVK